MELNIDPELKDFITPLKEDEFEGLTTDLQTNGCIEPIIVWNTGNKAPDTIVDGHNRYRICQEYNIPFKTVRIKFADKLAVITWMYNKQRGRRNLSIVEKLELLEKLKEYASKCAEKRKLSNLKQFSGRSETKEAVQSSEVSNLDLWDNVPGKTIQKIAKEVGVSYDTAFKYDAIQRKGTEEQKEALRTGQKKIGTVYREIQTKEKPVAEFQIQSNELDIEKLLKGKTIKTPYLLIYSKIDAETGKEMQAELSNCQPNSKLKMCADSIVMRLIAGQCADDKVTRFRLIMQSIVSEFILNLDKKSLDIKNG